MGRSVYAREEFVRRTGRQAESPGFVLAAARDGDGVLHGFSFGLPFGAGRWWRGRQETPPPDELVRAEKDVLALPLH